jgi:hypothetical protein
MFNGTTSESCGKPPIMMVEFRSIGWWYWLLSAGFLTAQVAGWPMGLPLAIGLTAFQFMHFALRTRSVRSFAAQVRLAYLLLLLIAAPERFRLMCWIPTMGTWVQVLFGYCGLARTVSLMPWNREVPLSMALFKRTFLSAPVKGSFMQVKSHARTLQP